MSPTAQLVVISKLRSELHRIKTRVARLECEKVENDKDRSCFLLKTILRKMSNESSR